MEGYCNRDNQEIIIDYINPYTNELLMIKTRRVFANRIIEALEGQGCKVAVFSMGHRPVWPDKIREYLENKEAQK